MYNIDDLSLNSNGASSYEESQMYCEYLSATSHLYEPRDATTREQVLLAINESFRTDIRKLQKAATKYAIFFPDKVN